MYNSSSIIISNTNASATSSPGSGITLSGASNNQVSNSRFTSTNGYYGIRLQIASNNNTISNSTITSETSGIYFSQSNNNTLIYSAITAYQDGIGFYSSSSNSISDLVATSTNGNAVSLSSSSSNNIFININATSTIHPGFYIYSSFNNTLGNSQISGKDNSDGALSLYAGSKNNTIANSTINGMAATRAITLQQGASIGNIFINNTLLNATTLLYLDSGASNNTFYWNNFTYALGYYVQDLNGSNFYNSTISGQSEGNIWANVINGRIGIMGTRISLGFPGLFIGNSSYNTGTSRGMVSGTIVDYAPLTANVLRCLDNSSLTNKDIPASLDCIGKTYALAEDIASSATAINVSAPNVTIDCNGFSITGNGIGGTYGIFSNQSNTIIRNCIVNSFPTVIMLSGVSHANIFNITGISNGYGIILNASSNNSIANSAITANSSSGILVNNSSNNQISNSWISGKDNTNGALSLYAGSKNNTIANSTINGMAATRAITLQQGASIGNIFINNTLLNATTLLYLDSGASNNTFYWNNFTGPTWVIDLGSNNAYNTSNNGNTYCLENGAGSWEIFDIYDANSDKYSDFGANIPFNSSMPGRHWIGKGSDFHPYSVYSQANFSANSPANANVVHGAPQTINTSVYEEASSCTLKWAKLNISAARMIINLNSSRDQRAFKSAPLTVSALGDYPSASPSPFSSGFVDYNSSLYSGASSNDLSRNIWSTSTDEATTRSVLLYQFNLNNYEFRNMASPWINFTWIGYDSDIDSTKPFFISAWNYTLSNWTLLRNITTSYSSDQVQSISLTSGVDSFVGNGGYAYFLVSGDPKTTSGGCAFVYSLSDDGRYYPEFAISDFAVHKAYEYTSFGLLPHLGVSNGALRLVVSEEVPETQHLDTLLLDKVGHPNGTQVIPSQQGGMHTIRNPVLPSEAIDDYNDSYLSQISIAGDYQAWVANASRINLSNPPMFESLRMRFPRQAGQGTSNNTFKLVVTAKDRAGATNAWSTFVTALGGYARLNSNVSLLADTTQWVQNNALLYIYVKNSTGDWQFVSTIMFGNLMFYHTFSEVLPILSDGDAEVMLSGIPFVYQVDQAYVDYGDDEPVQVQRLLPIVNESQVIQKTSQTGIAAKLASADNVYYLMDLGDRFPVTFIDPFPNVDGTYIIESKAYSESYPYDPASGHVVASPNESVVQGILYEPGYDRRLLIPHIVEAMPIIYDYPSRILEENGQFHNSIYENYVQVEASPYLYIDASDINLTVVNSDSSTYAYGDLPLFANSSAKYYVTCNTSSGAARRTETRLLYSPGVNCSNLLIANSAYVLSANVYANSSTCMNVTAANITLDCNGYSIIGNNISNTCGVHSSQFKTTIKNCIISNFSNAICLAGATAGLFVNNTLASSSNTLLFLTASAAGNTFYWNNFTNTSGVYVNDTNGSNYYNATINGQPTGNFWANVLNGSVKIGGTIMSPYGYYYGSEGVDYPYSNATAQGKLIGAVFDYAPFTPSSMPPSQGFSGSGLLPTPSLSYFFNCSSAELTISAKISGSPISRLNIRLYDRYVVGWQSAATDSNGNAHFTITKETDYRAENEQASGYLIGSTDSFSLKFCRPAWQPPTQPGQNISSPSFPGQNATLPAPNQTHVEATAGMGAAQLAVSEADKQVTSALIAGKDVSDAIWKISAAKSALASKDYEIALQLAKEASQLASEAKIRQDITIPTLSIPAVPDDAKPTVVAGGGLMVVGGAVLAIAVVITAYLFFIRKTKHS